MESILKSRKRSKSKYTPLVFNILNKSNDISHLPQIKWGIEHEQDAIKLFLSDVASKHANGMNGFKQCGLFIKAGYAFLAASTDGLFVCDCCSPAILAEKCPFLVKEENINRKATYKRVDFLEEVDGSPRLKHTHKYYTQMQAQMWVTGTNHGYLIVCTKVHKPLYDRVEFNREYVRVVLNNITLFYKIYTLPVLLGIGISTRAQSGTKLYWRNQKSLTCQMRTVFVVIPVAHGGNCTMCQYLGGCCRITGIMDVS